MARLFEEIDQASAAHGCGVKILIPARQILHAGLQPAVSGDQRRNRMVELRSMRSVALSAAGQLFRATGKRRMVHVERAKDVLFGEIGQRFAAHTLDNQPQQQVIGIDVFVVRSGREIQCALRRQQAQAAGDIGTCGGRPVASSRGRMSRNPLV